MTVPTRTAGGVRLRALDEADLPFIVEQCRDPEMIRFTPIPPDYGPAQAKEFLATVRSDWSEPSGTAARTWAMDVAVPDAGGRHHRGTGDPVKQTEPAGQPRRWRFAGTIGYRPDSSGGGSVGYAVHPDCRGSGVATRALRIVLEHAFVDAGLEVLHWEAVPGNWASRRVAWACGFRVQGRLPGLLDHRGARVDGWWGSLHRDDPRSPPHPWHRTPTLDADGVLLRGWRDDDGDRLPAARDALSEVFLGEVVPTRGSFAAWWMQAQEAAATGERVTWCLADPETGAVLGGYHLFRLADPRSRQGRVGYWLVESARGRGVVARATTAVLGWALTPQSCGGLGLVAVSADADVANVASIRALHRAGFRDVGVRRRAGVRADGTVVDLLEVDLLDSELPVPARSADR